MSADFFVDSNIVLYALDKDTVKNAIALDLIRKRPIISTQVVLESVNICLRKFKFSKEVAYRNGINLINTCSLSLIDQSTILSAFRISIQYQYSHWDSLIVASALQSNCATLYSEDLQHEQVVEGKLTIINPFLDQEL